MGTYQRILTHDFIPFDPLALAKETEEKITRMGPDGLERKYTGIYSAPVYGGIATGYAVGCCLRCVYCWSNWSRDFPERFGKFYSPKQVSKALINAAEGGITSPGWERFSDINVNKLRISGCEPTLAKEHLLPTLEYVTKSTYPLFILETNGILLGSDKNYVKRLARFSEKLYVRVSLKAATSEGFTQRTGSIGTFYELPFRALKYLMGEGIYCRAAAMTDPKVMPGEEREILLNKLSQIDRELATDLEEEQMDAYETTMSRLKAFQDKSFLRKLEQKILKRR